jgi:hypothetical protein
MTMRSLIFVSLALIGTVWVASAAGAENPPANPPAIAGGVAGPTYSPPVAYPVDANGNVYVPATYYYRRGLFGTRYYYTAPYYTTAYPPAEYYYAPPGYYGPFLTVNGYGMGGRRWWVGW